jgi:hypothetical protein
MASSGANPKNAWAALALLLACASRAAGEPVGQPWPPFLGPPDTFPGSVVADVEHVWAAPTFHRAVRGRPAHVPFDVYVAFVDTPDVTAAAARFRKLARYEVQSLGAGRYRADDHAGAQGVYQVLAREPTRRVILSQGEHTGSILGTITGSALTVLDLEPRDGAVDQQLIAYVKIDNAVAAALARVFILLFGHLADRELVKGFTVSAEVAEWAVSQPAAFCDWLQQEALPPDRRERVQSVLPGCR